MARAKSHESLEDLKARAEHSYRRAEEIIEEWQAFVDQRSREVRVARVVDGNTRPSRDLR
jgi:hypothetical protein